MSLRLTTASPSPRAEERVSINDFSDFPNTKTWVIHCSLLVSDGCVPVSELENILPPSHTAGDFHGPIDVWPGVAMEGSASVWRKGEQTIQHCLTLGHADRLP